MLSGLGFADEVVTGLVTVLGTAAITGSSCFEACCVTSAFTLALGPTGTAALSDFALVGEETTALDVFGTDAVGEGSGFEVCCVTSAFALAVALAGAATLSDLGFVGEETAGLVDVLGTVAAAAGSCFAVTSAFALAVAPAATATLSDLGFGGEETAALVDVLGTVAGVEGSGFALCCVALGRALEVEFCDAVSDLGVVTGAATTSLLAVCAATFGFAVAAGFSEVGARSGLAGGCGVGSFGAAAVAGSSCFGGD